MAVQWSIEHCAANANKIYNLLTTCESLNKSQVPMMYTQCNYSLRFILPSKMTRTFRLAVPQICIEANVPQIYIVNEVRTLLQ